MKYFNKFLAFAIFSICVFLSACKKENETSQWDTKILAPLFKAHLTLNNLFGDNNLHTDSQGRATLIFETENEVTSLDTLINLLDTSVKNVFIAPFPILLNPGTTIPPIANTIKIGSGDIQLRNALIKKGSLILSAHNRLTTGITYTYIIPSATLNGMVFTKVIYVPAAVSGVPNTVVDTFNISNYFLDLTGIAGAQFNRIVYNVSGITDGTGSSVLVFTGDTLLNISSSFVDVLPYVVRGYLGTTSFTDTSRIQNVDFFKIVESGNILLDEATLDFSFKNYIGVELQTRVTKLNGVNNSMGQTVQLQSADLINRNFNINRAVETGNSAVPIIPFIDGVTLNNSNSNLKSFLENLPDQLGYGFTGNFNPLGNISGSNDFIYSDSLLNTKLKITLPLNFAASNLTLVDTLDFNFSDTLITAAIRSGEFKLIAENGFPIRFDVTLFLLDENMQLLETIISPSTIEMALVNNATLLVTQPVISTLTIPFNEITKSNLHRSKKMGIKATINTYNQPALIQLYSNNFLNLKLIGDFIYRIN